ncbi:Gibberellin-regulated protein 12 [Acorus gramineus]|uniref:Gibberellin-regulated protein 12 n=1 Tax=Acorus gramineus TaxID=55184 RepID=A0AAV9A5V4_ACOGR|nr:Gibberellin-regulated protein 12 [Acorus gramineus]
MARFFFAILLFVGLMFVLDLSQAEKTNDGEVVFWPLGGEGPVTPEECSSKCDYRCSATSHKKPCKFFCNYCCVRCHCVPSGTYGHKEECPCYNDMKTKEGKPKCP